MFVGALASGFAAEVAAAGAATNVGFSGFSQFDPGRDPGRDMRTYLTRLGLRPLLMVHPGLPDPDSTDDIAAARNREHRFLASNAWPELLMEYGLRLAKTPTEDTVRP